MHKKMPSYNLISFSSISSSKHVNGNKHTLQLAHPEGICQYRDVTAKISFISLPGFLAPQSAHRSLPGTVLISSCNALSLRA